MDHIVTLQSPGDLDYAAEWYKLHVLLSHRMGERVDQNGNTRWLWSADPRLPGTSHMHQTRSVLVRTFDEETAAAARDFAVASVDQFIPETGDTVQFFLNCSSRENRPGREQSVRIRRDAARAGRKAVTAACPGNTGKQYDVVERLLEKAGLELIGDFSGFEDKPFRIYKNGRPKNLGFTIVGLFASGVVRVVDGEALAKVMSQGVGRDRGLGFGMLMFSPLEQKAAA